MRPLRPALLLALVCALPTLSACSKKPTLEQCEGFADHFIALLQASRDKPDPRIKQLAQSQGQKIIDACTKDGTVKEVECVMAQDSILDVEANCK